MKDPLQNIELIERYFDSEMSEDEKAKFKESLKTDIELKHLFDRENLLISTVRFRAAKRNLEFLKDLDRSLPEVQPGKNIPYFETKWKYYTAIAATVTLLIVAILMLRPENSPQKLYAEYYTAYPNVFEPTVRGEIAGTRSEAFQAYENKAYEKAIVLFKEQLAQKSDAGILLLLGNANLETGNIAEAKANFQQLMNISDDLNIQAKWYLSLCYLREGEIESAKKLLLELGDMESSYTAKAKELLEKVN